MTDLYIATPTQADYDALMRLAEDAGYTWSVNGKPTQFNVWDIMREGTAIALGENKIISYGSAKRMERDRRKVETIPNLADIKAIYRFENEESFNFFHETHDKHLSATSHKNPFAIEYSDGSVLFDYESMYKALAVEYKPRESEVMPEKVKLPKFMCEWLDETRLQSHADYPFNIISDAINALGSFNDWLWEMPDNQWKLIDALRYGYEPEPEQLYYVDFGTDSHSSFLNQEPNSGRTFINARGDSEYYKTQFTMSEIIAIDPRYKAFAVPVEEVDNDD